jgi:hypothetical protein
MSLYRLRKSIRVQSLTDLLITSRLQFTDIAAGETVESISGPNQEGRLLIRYGGHCYRAWKEELQNEHIAQKLVPVNFDTRSQRELRASPAKAS